MKEQGTEEISIIMTPDVCAAISISVSQDGTHYQVEEKAWAGPILK